MFECSTFLTLFVCVQRGEAPLHSEVSENHTDTMPLSIECSNQDVHARVFMYLCACSMHVYIQRVFMGLHVDYAYVCGLYCVNELGHLHTGAMSVQPFSPYFCVRMCVQGQDGQTPLHYAISKNHTDATELLIKCNADLEALDVRPISVGDRQGVG